jgi:hypothetical protein
MVEWLSYCICIRWNSVQSSTLDIKKSFKMSRLRRFCPAQACIIPCDTCRCTLPPPLPISATVPHRNCAAIPPSIAHLSLSPIAIALQSCNLASPLDALQPLNMPAGCHVGLVVLASPPRQWGCGAPPLPGCGYPCYSLVCCRGHLPWRCCLVCGDKVGTNNDNRGNDE